MDWGSVPPLLTVVVASVAALAGAMWAVVRVIRAEVSNAIHSRFDAVESRFDAMDYRFDGVDKRFDGVDRRLDELRVDYRTLAQRIDRMVEGLPALRVT